MRAYTQTISCKAVASLFIALFLFTQSVSAQLFINEWMASNDNAIADNFGDFDDWIEIYNAGSSDLDLAGYYITDDPLEPTKWQIPSGNSAVTTVPAGGFLLLWADNDTDQGENHVGFKLSASGEQISLYQSDGTSLVDEVIFGPQASNTSSGRIPDGSDDIQIFISSTPSVSNSTAGGDVTYSAMYTYQIVEGDDDAKQFEISQGWMNLDGTIIYMTQPPATEYIGLRFQGIDVPQGATINNVYLQFTNASSTQSSGDCNLTIQGENVGNSAPYVSVANNIYDRTTTTASVSWTPPDWTTQDDAGILQQSPNLTSIVQEIVNRTDWAAGNALSFVVSGTTGTRIIRTFDNDPDRAAKMIIEVEQVASNDPVNDVFINEVAARGTEYVDEQGERDDWVELYNGGSSVVNLGGFFLTDDITDLTKWQISAPLVIQPGGFATIWADNDPEQGGLHTNFNLSGAGEDLALVQVVDGAFHVIDQISFGEIPFEATHGRETDGASNFVTFGNITPNASNNGAALWLAPPVISLDNGMFNTSQTTSITHSDPSVDIRYEIDGSEPTMSSPLYTTELTVDATQSLKATAFKAGNYKESQSAVRSYLFVTDPNLPVLHINTDPDNFFDDEIGIYVVGTNGIPGYCDPTPRNYVQDWTRPVNITLFETNGDVGFNVNAGIKIGGGCSRNMALRSLNISVKEKTYGSPPIDYPLYEGRNTTQFEKLKLRNSGQDYLRMGFRDAAVQALLWDEVDIDLQGYKPVILYINDLYWGIINIRELYTNEYFEFVYDIKSDELDLIKNAGLSWQELKRGDDIDYDELYNWLENNDLNDPTNYTYAESKIDIDEFLNYWISSIYVAANDWPANNQVVWKEKKADAKWRWGMFDNDNSTNLNFSTYSHPDFNTLDSVLDASHMTWPFHRNSTVFFRNLMDNTSFRDEYIQRTCTFSNIIFEPTRVNDVTDGIMDIIEPEINNHLDKWGAENALGGSYINWITNVNHYRAFYDERQAYMETFLNDHWNLAGTYNLTLNYNQNTGGTVVVNWNDMKTPFNYQGKYFKNIPLRIKAIAKQGYTFQYWLETGDINPVIDFTSDVDATLTPIFQINVDLGDNIEICEGESTDISTGLEDCTDCSFSWSTSENISEITVTPLVNTTYTITVTDPSGVTSTDMVEVLVSPELSLTEVLTEPTLGENDGAITVTPVGGVGPYNFNWNISQNGPTIVDLSGGTYEVTVTDAYDCEFTASYEIGIVSTSNLDNILSVNLFPNPTSGSFQINAKLKESRDLDITIYNTIGHRVFNTTVQGKNLSIPINLRENPKGLYIIEIKSKQDRIYKKLLLR